MTVERGRSLPLALLALLLVAGLAVALVPSVVAPERVPCHRDLLDFFLPMKVVFARAVSAGEIPWWEPWTLGGRPFFADLQAQVLYPPNWLFAAVPVAWGLSAFLALHVALGGLGAVVMARSMGRSRCAALTCGVAFAGSGFAASLVDLSNQACTFAWLPWCVAAAAHFGRRPTLRRLALLVVLTLLSLLGGEPQLAVLGGLLSCGVAWWSAAPRTATRRTAAPRTAPPGPGRGRAGVLAGLAALPLLVGLAASVQLVPFGELVLRSDRVGGTPYHAGGRHHLGARQAMALVTAPSAARLSPAGSYLRSLHVGVLVLPLALLGALSRHRYRALLLGLTAGSLLLAAAPTIPLAGDLLLRATPFLRYPLKYFSIASLTLPLLAAAGLDAAAAAARRSSGRGWRLATQAALLGAPLLVALDLGSAHAVLAQSLPAQALLAPTPLIELLERETAAGGPRVHATPVTAERLRQRSLRLRAGDSFGATRERVELLEGGLPSVFLVHSTWGGAALTVREQAVLLEQGRGPLANDVAQALQAAWLLDRADRNLALPVVPVQGGAARLHLLPEPVARSPRRFVGTSRATGPAGLPPPSAYPGWTETSPGEWRFRPRGLPALAAVSALTLALLGLALALGGRVDLLGSRVRPG